MILNNFILLAYAQYMEQAIVPGNKPLPVILSFVVNKHVPQFQYTETRFRIFLFLLSPLDAVLLQIFS